MTKFSKIFKKNYLYFFFILFVLSHFTSFFTNIYTLTKRSYEERLLRAYGYCKNYSYGYIEKIQKQYLAKIKTVYLVNFDLLPESYGLFHELKKDENKENLIIVNYQEEKNHLLNQLNINLNKYELIDKHGQCLYYKKVKK